MAITIDGTGTISGLSSGGLPDNSVAPDDLTTGHPYWDSSGSVGIGTTSPATTLHVKQTNASLPALQLQHNDGDFILCEENGGTDLFKFSRAAGTNDLDINVINASNLKFLTSNTERMRIDSSGNVLVGRTVPGTVNVVGTCIVPDGSIIIERDNNQLMSLNRLNGNGTLILFQRGAGNVVGSIVGNTSSTSYNTSSDYRLKENVVEVTNGIDRVKLLKPSRFNFIADPNTTVDGFLAHEVADVIPEAITGTKDAVDADGNPEYQGIDQSKLVPLLTAALQEAITKIESLETEMITVKSRLDALESA